MLSNEAWVVEREALLNVALIVNGEEVLSDESWVMKRKEVRPDKTWVVDKKKLCLMRPRWWKKKRYRMSYGLYIEERFDR